MRSNSLMIIRFSVLAALVLTVWPAEASAQSLGEILGDTTRFIGRQLDELSREIDELTSPPPPPPRRRARPPRRNPSARPSNASTDDGGWTRRRQPPLPQRTPRRFLKGEQRSLPEEETAPALREISADDETQPEAPDNASIAATSSKPDAAEDEADKTQAETTRKLASADTNPATAEMTEKEEARAARYRWPNRLRIPRAKPHRKKLAARQDRRTEDKPDAPTATPLSGQPQPEKPEKAPETAPKAVHPRDQKAPDWTKAQIAAAKQRCKRLLDGLSVVYEELDPIREGRCGTPAPIMVARIGSPESVRLSPPATLTCEMAASLSKWFEKAVQPAALIHLGGPVTRVRNVSSYVCRHRYRNPEKPLSEHASANALDIAEFHTASGKRVVLTKHWVPDTGKSEQEKKTAGKKSEPKPTSGGTYGPKDASVRTADASQVKTAAVDANAEDKHGGEDNPFTGTTGMIAPPAKKTIGTNKPKSAEELFLREVHKKGCEVFGTVLGPEANAAHRDHFHLDMAKRRSGFCE